MTIADDAKAVDQQREHAALEAKLAEARRDRDGARHALKDAMSELAEMRADLALIEAVDAIKLQPPKWLAPKRVSKARRATVVSILSDCHWDEVVRPGEILGDNAYNRAIAELRLHQYVERLILTSFSHLGGVHLDGLVLALGGDMVTGELHDMAQTNDSSGVIETCDYWSDLLIAAIVRLLEAFGRVHVPCAVGNHGRLEPNKRQPSKLRGRRSFDWLIYRTVARHFASDDRVTFQIPDGADVIFDVHGTPFLLNHGNNFTSQGGVGGIYPPLLKWVNRTRERERHARRPSPCILMGHWHQYTIGQGSQFVVNGSTKGYDEYAHQHGFAPEPPQQAAMLVTPENGITFHWPVFVAADRKAEGW